MQKSNKSKIPEQKELEAKTLPIELLELNRGQIYGLPKNPRFIRDDRFEALKKSISDNPEMLEMRELLVYPFDEKFIVIGGNMRLRACIELGIKDVPCKVLPTETPVEKLRAYTMKDNIAFGETDWDALANEWDLSELKDFGMTLDEMPELDDESKPYEDARNELSLAERFGAPPLSVLDARAGYWCERKRKWNEIIGDNGESREGNLSFMRLCSGPKKEAQVSVLDPVLSELIVRWFSPVRKDGGVNAFDCFAGDSVFGFVASFLGANFTGIELREEQCELNNSRVQKHGLSAKYICDDGRNVGNHIAPESQDLFFSCPPYFDLEVYSDKPNDASNQKTFGDFYAILDSAFSSAAKCLKQNRFAVVVVGEVRNKKTGGYYDFIGSVKKTFLSNGFILYNDAILLDPVASAALRAQGQFNNRKLCKVHQNVLVFFKGDQRSIADEFGVAEAIASEDLFFKGGKDGSQDE